MSERGKALQKENVTLTKHHASLLNGLADAESALAKLNDQNSDLHQKIFETSLGVTAAPASGKENLLLADASGFRTAAGKLKDQSSEISKLSAAHNAHFRTMDVRQQDLEFLVNVPSIQPVENAELTRLVSGFGKRINPFHKGIYQHPGADFAAARGTSIVATARGTVIDMKNGSTLQAGYGNYIEIDHGNGLVTRYAHLDDVFVRVGQRVSKGMKIGTAGMSGGAVAPHVHYEIIRKGTPVDPVPYMMENLNSDQYAQLIKLGSKKNQSLD
jgi:murein DD-endopeptidase MepM/ murein hydrolase activator NlpD